MNGPEGSALYRCRIRHERTAPVRHGFGYRTHLWLVDLDHPPKLPAALRPLARFRAADHLGPGTWSGQGEKRGGRGGGGSGERAAAAGKWPGPAVVGVLTSRPLSDGPARIKAELIDWCAHQGADVSDCRILMLTAARSLGFVFNPLTVFWCLDADGHARYVVAEVHNTYHARHSYLFVPQGDHADIEKQFYVSPFFGVDGDYRMTVPVPGKQLHIAITLTLPDGTKPFVATVRGDRRPSGTAQLLRALARDPFAGYRVPLAIRYQAIRLLLRGLRIQPGHRGPVAEPSTPDVSPVAATPAPAGRSR